jgi:RimJ/RimL family protein N-acetyltransferase/SAM-dependent methyltransferase
MTFAHPLGDGAVLAQLEPWHAEQFAAAVDKAREHLAPWIPFAHTVTDVDTARDYLRRLANDHASDTRHGYAIWDNGTMIGGVLFPRFDVERGTCEIGVWLVPDAQGRGLITRAARELVDWAIRERGMVRVAWHAAPGNERSKAVARRLGMTFEGVARSGYRLAGVQQDEEVWSVLAPEWRSEPAAFFDTTYGNFGTDVQAAVRRGAFGEDIGQNSWLTAAEWRRYVGWLDLSEGKQLLDIASGSGGPAVCAAVETGCGVVGLDSHAQGVATGVRLAAERGVSGRVRLVEGDASARLPFDDATFDAVTCIDAIHHLPDRSAALAECRRVLRPGGRLLYTDPIVVTGMLSNDEIRVRSSIGFFQFTPLGVNERLLDQAGFDVARAVPATDNMRDIAIRWRQTRAELHEAVVRLEGAATFDAQQEFFRMVAELAAAGRLSRYAFHATKR